MHSESVSGNIPEVFAVISISGRTSVLERVLNSLKNGGPHLIGVVVNDNGNTEGTRPLVGNAPVPSLYVKPAKNLGCGGGVANALKTGLEHSEADYFWILDDDCVIESGSLEPMIAAMGKGADAAVPMVIAENRVIGWFPGLLEPEPWALI